MDEIEKNAKKIPEEIPADLISKGYGMIHVGNTLINPLKKIMRLLLIRDNKERLAKTPIMPRSPLSSNFKDIISIFEECMKKAIGEEKCALLTDNCSSLKMQGINLQMLGKNMQKKLFPAYYSPNNNVLVIKVGEGYDRSAIIGELMTVACTNRRSGENDTRNRERSQVKKGFEREDSIEKKSYGRELTTGYASLLSQRYFGSIYTPPYCDKPFYCMTGFYSSEYSISEIPVDLNYCIAAMIEQIVGREKMEAMFFSADYYDTRKNGNKYPEDSPSALIDELSKYDSIQNIRNLLISLDEFDPSKPQEGINIIKKVCEWAYIKQVKTHSDDMPAFYSTVPLGYYNTSIYEIEKEQDPQIRREKEEKAKEKFDKKKIQAEAKGSGMFTLSSNEINSQPGFPKAGESYRRIY